jgi:UDP-N-acetylmuramate--alanine ligase
MKEFDHIRYVYFLGAGGIGMSALARWFRHVGLEVAGYDRTLSALTHEMAKEGIFIHDTDLGKGVSKLVGRPEDTLVVLTPAIPPDHGEWNWLRDYGFPILKRSKVLGIICNNAKCMAVAGTHGKTTVSTMAATILKTSSLGCGAFLGGISKNFNSNLLLPEPGNEWLVTEADEYDRSFLQLTPNIAVITYLDADHLDIYGSHHEMKESFMKFAGQVRDGGTLILNSEISHAFGEFPGRKVVTYSLSGESDFCALDLQINPATKCYRFRLQTPRGETGIIEMNYPGILNVENGIAAGAAAYMAGASLHEIKEGLETYSGVKRRFDIRYRDSKFLFIDDYAHHPRELSAFIRSVRLLYPEEKITGIFQPHLYSRTHDFATGFAESLDLLDTALLLPIYPARELPMEGVSSELILNYMQLPDKQLMEKPEVIQYVRDHKPAILLTMGAGDIELLADDIISVLKNEQKN